jgi:hypothetical protein
MFSMPSSFPPPPHAFSTSSLSLVLMISVCLNKIGLLTVCVVLLIVIWLLLNQILVLVVYGFIRFYTALQMIFISSFCFWVSTFSVLFSYPFFHVIFFFILFKLLRYSTKVYLEVVCFSESSHWFVFCILLFIPLIC